MEKVECGINHLQTVEACEQPDRQTKMMALKVNRCLSAALHSVL